MNSNIVKTAVLLVAIAGIGISGCGGRDVNSNTDDGRTVDTGAIDIEGFDISGIDLVGLDLNSLDGFVPGDIFDQDGPIARLQKSDLSVVCPPAGSDTAPGFQNGEQDIVMDVVVTAPRAEASSTLDRYFVAEATLSTTAPWAGSAMTVSKELGLPDFEVGDVLTVTVSHLEYYCMTQLQATTASRLDSGATINPIQVDPSKIGSQDPATAEPWEGVLVRLNDVTVTNPNLGYGQFEVTGGVIVKPSYGISYQATLNDVFDEIVGVVDYSYGQYVLLPRSNSDLVLNGGQPIDVIEPDMIDPADIVYELPDGVEPPSSIIAIQSSGDSTACSTPSSIKTIQEGLSLNDLVVVTPRYTASSNKLDGYYVCQGLVDPLVPYACITMTIDVAADEKFVPGDIIDVEGKYIEYYCLSEISATSATKTGTTEVPEGMVITPETLGTQSAATAEPLEGLLVTVENVEIIETPANGSDGKDHGAFKVTGNLVIGNDFDLEYMNSRTDGRAMGQNFLSITGVVSFTYGRYELMPRSMDDLVFDGDPIVVEKDQPDVIENDVSDTPYTVYDIQSAAESTGCTTNGFVNVFSGATFASVVVTTPKFSASADLDGYYVEDWPIAENREFHGTTMVAEKTLGTAYQPGDVLSPTDCSYYEYYCHSQIEIGVAAGVESSETAPTPVSVPLSLLENGGMNDAAEAEKYEGLLVTIPATTITSASSSDAKTWFEVGDGIHISNQFYIQDFTPVADSAITSITGVVRYYFGKYRLAPVSAAHIVLTD